MSVSITTAEATVHLSRQTGLMLTPTTAGILLASLAAERFARRRPQRWLVIVGFIIITTVGMGLLLALVREDSGTLSFLPGLFPRGFGLGTMLTSSVNIVQFSFPDSDQGEISGLSRSVSNLGSSLGTALAGSVLVAVARPGGQSFALALALATLAVFSRIGLLLSIFIPRQRDFAPAADAALPS